MDKRLENLLRAVALLPDMEEKAGHHDSSSKLEDLMADSGHDDSNGKGLEVIKVKALGDHDDDQDLDQDEAEDMLEDRDDHHMPLESASDVLGMAKKKSLASRLS